MHTPQHQHMEIYNMKIEKNLLFAIAAAGILSLSSSVAFAGISSVDENKQSAGTAPKLSHAVTLEKIIAANTEQKLAAEAKADAKKYTQVIALAGDKQDEVVKRKNEVINTYKTWRELKAAVEGANSASANDFKAIEAAARAYSQANKAFLDLQKNILAQNGVPSGAVNNLIATNAVPYDVIDAINNAPPTAAGLRK